MNENNLKSIILLLIPFVLSGCEKQNNKKPNVILLVTDNQRYGDLSCHGNP
jgi:hypothetical protein